MKSGRKKSASGRAQERRAYELTGEFSNAFTEAAAALNTLPVTDRTLELVRER